MTRKRNEANYYIHALPYLAKHMSSSSLNREAFMVAAMYNRDIEEVRADIKRIEDK